MEQDFNDRENPKRIFLLRHANYQRCGQNLGLSDFGLLQARELAQKIKEEIDGVPEVTIWTSPAVRAKETASIIKESLTGAAVTLVEYEKLWSDDEHYEDFAWLKRKLDNFSGDTLIIVTHLAYVNDFPSQLGFKLNSSGYAEGILIKNDLECLDF